jgi:hypothetical protein
MLRQTGTTNIIRQSFGDLNNFNSFAAAKPKEFDFDDDKSSDEDGSDLSFDKNQDLATEDPRTR